MARPTKLTPESQEKICQILANGSHIEPACALAGIHPSTFFEWIQRNEGRHPKLGQTPEFTEFSEATTRAITQGEIALVTKVKIAQDSDWRAAAWMLERRYPERWANTQRIKLQVEKELEATLDALQERMRPESYAELLQALATLGHSPTPVSSD